MVNYFAVLVLCIALPFLNGCKSGNGTDPDPVKTETPVQIKLLGHSCFSITTPDSLCIITDPYGTTISYLKWSNTVDADIVTVSHGHADHCQIKGVQGSPLILQNGNTGTIGAVQISAYETQHGDWNGQKMGNNWIYVFQIGTVKLVHLGETASFNDSRIFDAIRNADVLLVPVGQTASLKFNEISTLIDTIKARTIVPHHFSPSAQNRYYNSSTSEEFAASAQSGIPISYGDSLDVTSGMPGQIMILKVWYTK